MKRTCAKIIVAAMLALLLVAGCKNDDDEDDTPAVEYKVLAGRLILYSGDGANVIVPTGTASIGNNAFKGCARLENVFIPASVTYIAGGAFRGVEIGYIAYGDTVAHWEEVVAGSSGLAASLAGQSVFCTDGVWNAPTNPNPGGEPDVPGNPSDWQITDGDGVLTAYTGSGTHVTVPDGVTAIGPGAFAGSDVTAADIPASVTSIGTGAFADGTVLTFHGTREQWEQLVENSDLTGLTVVAVDDDGVLVGYSGNETHVTIPDGVTAIGPGAFADGTVLTFHGTAEQWEQLVENSDLTGLTVVAVDDDGVLVGYSGSGTHVTIPDGVTAIGDGAFAGHAEITDVVIPKSVTDIGADAFKDCTGLTDVTIPGSVTSIGDGAFSGCTGLTDVTIPGSVTNIGDGAFSGCTGLTDVVIPGSVTSIGDGAFSGCSGLTDVTIPGSVTGIGDGAFSGCTGLTDVKILSGVETIGDDAFKDCTGLTDVTIPGSVTSIGEGAFGGCTGLTDITYGGSREQLEDLCADSGIDLSGVTVTISDEASLWDIRDGVLLGYYGSETDIVIPDSVTAIGADAFAGNTGLTGVEIPAGVTGIGDGAFKGCTGLTDLEIPASVTGIGAGALACGNLETIAFAGTVAQWVGLAAGSGVGDDVIVTCSDGTLPTTVYVAVTGSDDNPGSRAKPFATIQKAVDTIIARNDGSNPCTIYVDGTLTQSAAASANGMADFSALGKNLTLTIQSLSGTATLDANGKSRVIKAPASGALNLTLENLVITGGNTTGNGGGIYYQSTGGILTVKGCAITGNEANYGGGVYVYGGTFTMSGGTISNCTANSYGGGVYINSSGTFNMSGTAKIAGCKTTSTSSNSGGGGIYNVGTVTITGGTVSDCTSATNGGGVYVGGNNGKLTMSGGTITGNEANSGGGVYINSSGTFDMSGTAKITGCKTTSTSGSGGGIYNEGTLAITGGTVSDCTSATNGGGVYVSSGTFTMSGGTIAGNIASSNGGGVFVYSGTFNLTDGTIGGTTSAEANTASNGGGVYVYKGTFTMEGGEISNCTASSYGGGVFINSSGTFNMSGTAKITGCKMTSTSSRGGGVYVSGGNFTMSGGTITGNTASDYGGGVYVSGGTFTMGGGEISNCTASSFGGGVYVSGGTFTMSGGTISGNTASSKGGGVYVSSGTFNMSGTAKIAGCKTTSSNGGGVYVSGGNFTMGGGTISGNTASNYGGGVCVSGGTFTMSGGTISGNTASSKGGGVYVSSGTFTMGGSASIPAGDDGKNDVFLANGKTITVAGALTAATPVATITPSAYTEGTQVLGAGTGVTITQGICDKFAVTPQADGTKWKINLSGNTGVLKKDEVSTGGGGISVVLPTGTYTFKIESGGSEVVNGSKLQYGTSIVLSEVRKDGVLLTASDGTFTIDLQDESGNSFTSATGYQAAVTVPTSVPPIGMGMRIYVKVALTSGIVIDQTIQVTGP